MPAPTPRVSVALCTHNGAEFVAAQVRSIRAQTLRPHEIVLSDDASTDGTVDIAVAELAGSGISLRVLRNSPALGVTANFEQAVRACSGELIALCDQDDEWSPDRLARLVPLFERRPELQLVHGDATLADAQGLPTGSTLFGALEVSAADVEAIHEGRAFSLLLKRNVVTGATVVLRRELVPMAQPFPASWVHDEWLAIVAAAVGMVDVVEEPLLQYRQHGGNQIGARKAGLGDKIARLRASRADRNARLLARAAALAERLALVPGAEGLQSMVDAKLAHERLRSSLPAPRLLRILPVLRESAAGGYRHFGRGGADVLRDLVQPA